MFYLYRIQPLGRVSSIPDSIALTFIAHMLPGLLEGQEKMAKSNPNSAIFMEDEEADICQLGMDQRKVNVLAREYCDDTKRKNKPIILSHLC
ncbi:putative tyrosine--tRNA ligase [Helianthus annuus]|nr:putative tyrosine--tRNA ligase [Helianthus annuus]KAJ0768341.1 putative tyrosine--tRNA ligase [Helianthus annuus]KAJ0774102.1 putative tyrosine--tRNA ligase [Helianthus annuus]